MSRQILGGTAAVAVVIPCYNAEKFVRRALCSVLEQTLAPAEVVVVDDGSKDTTCRIVEAEFPSVRIVRQQNAGPSRARNAGVRASRSPLIAFLDADDWWEPGKLVAQVEKLYAHPGAVANYTALRFWDDSGQDLGVQPVRPPQELWPRLRWVNEGIPPSCWMVRRKALEVIGGFSERQVGSEDWHLLFGLRQLGELTICPEPLTCYRLSPGGLSGKAEHMFNGFKKMLDDTLLTGFTGLDRTLWRRRIISYQAYKACLTARGAGDSAVEQHFMKLSVSTWPFPTWAPERFKAFAVTALRHLGLR